MAQPLRHQHRTAPDSARPVAPPTVWPLQVCAAYSLGTADAICAIDLSLKSTVPWPLASKYTPTSKSCARWCRCFTPVFAHATGTPATCSRYVVELPLA